MCFFSLFSFSSFLFFFSLIIKVRMKRFIVLTLSKRLTLLVQVNLFELIALILKFI